MSWESTSERWQAIREVSAELERNRDGVLPWQPRYADIFGDREGLLAALRYRWQLIVRAQEADPSHATIEQVLHELTLTTTHRGLLLALGITPRAELVPAA